MRVRVDLGGGPYLLVLMPKTFSGMCRQLVDLSKNCKGGSAGSKTHGFVTQASVSEKGVTRLVSADECSKCDYS